MFRFNIPRKFTGEGRILKVFTRKSFFYTAIGTGIGFLILKFFTYLDWPIIGLVLGGLCIIPFYLFGRFTYSKDLRENAGEDLDTVIFRKLRKRLNRVIYVTDWEE